MTDENESSVPGWKSGPARVVMVVAIVAAVVVGPYVWQFVIKHPEPSLSLNPEHWGQLGDYVGGLLNPVVALAALGLLAWSINLQKRELAETRQELEKTAMAQKAQVRLSALTALVNSIMLEIQMHRSYLEYLSREATNLERDQINAGRDAFGASHDRLPSSVLRTLAGNSFYVKDFEGKNLSGPGLQATANKLNMRVDELLKDRLRYEAEIKDLLHQSRLEP